MGIGTVSTMLGWRLGQWAEVAAYCKRFGDLPEAGIPGANQFYHCWRTHRLDEPGEHLIVGVEHEMDFAWASLMYERALRVIAESSVYGRL